MFHTVLRSSLSTTIRNAQRIPAARRLLTQQARAQLETTVKSSPVVVFMKGTPASPQCGFSRAVIQILELHGVSAEKFKAFDVLEDQSLRSDVKEFSDWPTVPQVYVDGEFIGGCDIVLSMHQSGDLQKLLQDKNVIAPSTEQANT